MEELEDAVTCPICMEIFTDPVSLVPCMHKFCRGCIESLSSSSGLRRGARLKCPTCRKTMQSYGPDHFTKELAHKCRATKEKKELEADAWAIRDSRAMQSGHGGMGYTSTAAVSATSAYATGINNQSRDVQRHGPASGDMSMDQETYRRYASGEWEQHDYLDSGARRSQSQATRSSGQQTSHPTAPVDDGGPQDYSDRDMYGTGLPEYRVSRQSECQAYRPPSPAREPAAPPPRPVEGNTDSSLTTAQYVGLAVGGAIGGLIGGFRGAAAGGVIGAALLGPKPEDARRRQ